ncbi:copper resistance protein CopC [Solibacillus sp. FSL K6-1781]|uniref:copper resistance CopC family protein n=1 Tax=Solibacillus sp. FSL K6-1781 TaxID=2921474 RepID=UPI00315A44A4
MMKQLLFALAAIFLLFVPEVYAHTHLESTNPAEGETVTENIQTIDLAYGGKIEEGSTFKVIASDGKEMAIHSISINEGVLSGIMLDPLPNDTYTVEWDSISEDGHPLTGSFTFKVNAPKTNKEEDSAADTTEKIENDVNSLVDTLKDETNSDEDDEGSFWTLIIVTALIVLVLTVITMYSYKRWLVKKTKK